MLEQLEAEARERDLMLRLQVGRPLGLEPAAGGGPASRQRQSLLLGEMKGWAILPPRACSSTRCV